MLLRDGAERHVCPLHMMHPMQEGDAVGEKVERRGWLLGVCVCGAHKQRPPSPFAPSMIHIHPRITTALLIERANNKSGRKTKSIRSRVWRARWFAVWVWTLLDRDQD